MEERKIVLVEDDDDTRTLLKFLLESEGYNVTTADDGRRAMEIVESMQPDILITDLMMPKVSGLELIRHTRQLHPAIPILLLSGNGDVIKYDALEAGATRIFVKPFDTDELLKTVKALSLRHREYNA